MPLFSENSASSWRLGVISLLLTLSGGSLAHSESLVATGGDQVVRTVQLSVGSGEKLQLSGVGTTVNIPPQVVVNGGSIEVSDGAWLATSSNEGASARLAEGKATAVVSGPGSTWTVDGNLEIGDAGEAHLSILNGGKVISGRRELRTRISGGKSTALVDGSGSSWAVTGYFEIGDGGEGHLTIANGGTVVSGLDGQRSRVSGGGGLPNDGSSAIISGTGSRWLVNGDFEVGDSGEAHLTIEGGGQVISGLNGDRTRVYGGGGRSEPATTATVRGQGSYWQIGGDFVVGGGGEAKLSVLDGGRVLSGLRGDSVVASADGESASVTVDGVGSSWSALTDLRLQGDRPARLNVWHGGNVSVGRTLRGDQDSVIDLDEGVLNATSIITEGVIRGTGDLRGSVASGGLIDPGHSLGHLSVQGSLELNPKGRLMIELSGTPDTVSSDLLSITGVALLDGRVDVTLLDGFMPKSGDIFTVLEFGRLRSTDGSSLLSRLELPDLGPALRWNPILESNELLLAVRPASEPSSGCIAICLLTTLAMCRSFRWVKERRVTLARCRGDHMRHAWHVIGLGLLSLGFCSQSYAAEFIPLGTLPGNSISFAGAISADGTTVVGAARIARSVGGGEAFSWTRAGGMKGLGDLPGGGVWSLAQAVSADGSIVAGSSQSSLSGSDGPFEPFAWTSKAGMTGLGGFAGKPVDGSALGMSADGGVLVGFSYHEVGGTPEPFRWTESTGMQRLGTLTYGHAKAVSADGSIIVGWAEDSGKSEAFRWTEDQGYEFLGQLPGAPIESKSIANGISADGQTIVGETWALRGGPAEAFRWTRAEGMTPLSFEGRSGRANDVSADGSMIVGAMDFGGGTAGQRAFFWRETGGVQLLDDWLRQVGGLEAELLGWRLTTVNAVSDDGQVLVGYGTNPSGNNEAFVVTVPEPSTFLLAALAGLGPLVSAGAIIVGRSRPVR